MAEMLTADQIFAELNAGSLRVKPETLPKLPRREGIFDTGLATNGNGAHPSQIDLMIDNQSWNLSSNTNAALGSSKVQGRDTNLAEKNHFVGEGEKFWGAGWSMKVTCPHTQLNNTTNVLAFVDEVRRARDLLTVEWQFNAGSYAFIRRPGRDVPFYMFTIVSSQLASAATWFPYTIHSDGMLDLRIGPSRRMLYVEGIDNSRISLKFTIASGQTILTPTVDIVYQFVFEGIRIVYRG